MGVQRYEYRRIVNMCNVHCTKEMDEKGRNVEKDQKQENEETENQK